MALTLISPPAVEPLSVAEAKDHLRVDHDDEDTYISSLILTSRLHIEAALSLTLIDQTWRWTFDAWPKQGATITLPLRPVSSINRIEIFNEQDVGEEVPGEDYDLDGDQVPPRIIRNTAQWPRPKISNGGIAVVFESGFGAAPEAVPQPIRHALALLVAHWYEHREPIEIGSKATAVPDTVSTLLQPYKVSRL